MGRRRNKAKIIPIVPEIDSNYGIGITADAKHSLNSLLSFSYKYLVETHSKFKYEGQESKYFVALLKRLKDISTMKPEQIKSSTHRALRCHRIVWEDTTESSFGIPKEEKIVDEPWQFSLSSNENGRVHGFFIGTVFYVVWFDPKHQLYS